MVHQTPARCGVCTEDLVAVPGGPDPLCPNCDFVAVITARGAKPVTVGPRHIVVTVRRDYRTLVKCRCGWTLTNTNESAARRAGARHEATGQ